MRGTAGAGFALAMASGGSTPSGRTSAGGLGGAFPFAGACFDAPGRIAFAVAGTSLRGRWASASAFAAARAAAMAFAASAPLLSTGAGLAPFAAGTLAAVADDLSAGFTTALAAGFAAGFSPGFFGAGFPLPDADSAMALPLGSGLAASFLQAPAPARH